MRYATIALLVLLFPLCVLLVAQRGADEGVVKITRDDFLSLTVSDSVREATGLWGERIHWRVVILDPEVASSEYWKGLPSESGKKTIVVFLDHPNGVDKTRFRETY